MSRQGSVRLAAAVLALGAAACFSDPTSSLRNGPAALQLSQYTVTLKSGDSLSIRALVLDGQGNQLDVGTPTWTSADPTIATVRSDGTAPGNIFAPAVVVGVNNQAGITNVTVDDQGLQATVRVTVLPAKFPGVVTVTGTAVADTVTVNRPAPLTPLVVPYTSGDTVVLNSTASVTFSATASTVTFGSFSGYVIRRSATQIVAMSRQPYAGPVTVTNLTYAGNASTGPISIASLKTDSINIQHSRFHGTVNITGDTLTLTAAAGGSFNTTAPVTTVQTNAISAVIFARSATTIRAIAPLLSSASYTGGFTIYNQTVGAVNVDSAHSTANVVALPRASWSGTAAVVGDTLTVTPPGTATFDTTTATVAGAKFGGTAAVLFAKSPTQLRFINQRAAYTGVLTVRRTILGIATVDSLKTTGNITIGQASFPGASAVVAGDTLTVTAPAGTTFDTTTATVAGVKFGGTAGTLFAKSTTQLRELDVDTIGYTGGVLTVRRLILGLATIDSLKTTGNITMNRATFPGTITTAGNLLDTVTVYSTAVAKFTTGASGSTVTIGGQPAWIWKVTADSLKVIPAAGSTGPITISKVKVGLASFSVPSAGTVAISGSTTNEANEPGNNTTGGATVLTAPARDSVTLTIFHGAEDVTDTLDFYTVTTVDSAKIQAVLKFLGNGTGAGGNPNLDVTILLSDGTTIPAGGATGVTATNQPEKSRTTALMPPGTYFVKVKFAALGGSTRPHETYRLEVSRIYP